MLISLGTSCYTKASIFLCSASHNLMLQLGKPQPWQSLLSVQCLLFKILSGFISLSPQKRHLFTAWLKSPSMWTSKARKTTSITASVFLYLFALGWPCLLRQGDSLCLSCFKPSEWHHQQISSADDNPAIKISIFIYFCQHFSWSAGSPQVTVAIGTGIAATKQ